MNTIPKLSVAIRVFNQEKEIVRALNSVIEQNVSYPVELVIGVDKSVDNSLEVVRKFCCTLPNWFTANVIEHQTNVGGVGNWISVLTACRGKYIAVLDGDDYWIDTEKCNKQIEILENNPNIGLVYADHYLEDENGKRTPNKRPSLQENVFSQMLHGNIVTSDTVMFVGGG